MPSIDPSPGLASLFRRGRAASTLAAFIMLMVPSCAAVGTADPLTRPVDIANNALWMKEQPPIHVHGETWLVGSAFLNVALIRTTAGLVLIDAGPPQMAPLVISHLAAAGFSIRDVKLILVSEPHYDHAGGIAALQHASGADSVASASAARTLHAGRSGREDPQYGTLFAYPPVRHVRVVQDGETLEIGGTRIKAISTPGHTPGSMSWSWRSCEDGDCADIVFATSMSPRTDGHFRYSDPKRASYLAAFRRSLDRLARLPCDIVLTGHPAHSGGDAKYQAQQADPRSRAYVDPDGCRQMADRYGRELDQSLAHERER